MSDDNTGKTILDTAISGNRGRTLAQDLRHHESRMAIKEVVDEHVGSALFSERIRDIQSQNLESTVTYEKISDKVQNQIDKTLSDRGLRNRNFYIPFIVSVVGVIVAVASVVVAIVK